MQRARTSSLRLSRRASFRAPTDRRHSLTASLAPAARGQYYTGAMAVAVRRTVTLVRHSPRVSLKERVDVLHLAWPASRSSCSSPLGNLPVSTVNHGPSICPRLRPSTGFDLVSTRSNQGSKRRRATISQALPTRRSPLCTELDPLTYADWAAALSRK